MTRVVVADDQALVRAGLKLVLEAEPDIEVVGEAADAHEVLVLTTFDEEEYLTEALRAGTSGFLLKVSPPAQRIAAIRTAPAGNALLDPAVTRRVIEAFGRRAATRPHGIVTPGDDA